MFIAEYQSIDCRYTARIWQSRGRLVLSTLDLSGPRARCHFPETLSQAHRWAKHLVALADAGEFAS